jgi:hypothetical protein
VLGKFDGQEWIELGRTSVANGRLLEGELGFTLEGDRLAVEWNGKRVLEARDTDYQRGTVGLRTGDAEALFLDFSAWDPAAQGVGEEEPEQRKAA